MRRGIQLFFLALFLLFFIVSPAAENTPVPADLFLKADPLPALGAAVAARQLHGWMLLSLAVIASAVLGGRIFCGYACPLGTLFDLAAPKAAKKKASGRLRDIKYGLLVFLCVCALFGCNLSGIFDPLSLLTRICSFVLSPLAVLTGNAALDIMRPAADALGFVYLAHAGLREPVFLWAFVTVLLGAALFCLNAFSPRFWCRCLCPLGALLGLFSRVRLLKRKVASRCSRCMTCRAVCPMDAIGEEPEKVRAEQCIVCSRCAEVCPERAVSFSFSALPENRKPPGTDSLRRQFLLSAGAGALAAFSLKISPAPAAAGLIRPPGALPEDLFLKACTRCGSCMHVCPTGALQPSLFESGLEGLWTPRVAARTGACDQTCTCCGAVCPTEAIRKLPLEEKKHAKLGTAYIDTDRCLAWAQDRLCLICDEQCPYNAIVFRWSGTARRPFVIDVKCNGCGFCEQACPVRGASAIAVTAQGEIRLAQGSYAAKARELNLQFNPGKDDDRLLPEEQSRGEQAAPGGLLPGGFTPP